MQLTGTVVVEINNIDIFQDQICGVLLGERRDRLQVLVTLRLVKLSNLHSRSVYNEFTGKQGQGNNLGR